MILEIAGFQLVVTESDSLPGDVNGHCDPAERTIIIRKGLKREEFNCVLFHEVGHFLYYRLFGSAETVDEESLCRLCEFFSHILKVGTDVALEN